MTKRLSQYSESVERTRAGKGSAGDPSLIGSWIFWRSELSGLGLRFDLKTLYSPISPCPVCQGTAVYRPEGTASEIACFCQLQSTYLARIEGWQSLNFLPEPLRRVELRELLALGRILNPIQRVQLPLVLESVDRFIDDPRGNLVFIGDAGFHCSMFAAYIAKRLEPLPSIFVTLRQLVDLLGDAQDAETGQPREPFCSIPVLIIDDFSSAYGELEQETARHLFSLVVHRHDAGLPVVITSDVELGKLPTMEPSILECLSQDAISYIFDYRQIRLLRPAQHQAGPSELEARPLARRCPWLGTADGAEPTKVFPILGHSCLRTTLPQPVTLAHQARACLSADHAACPVFQMPEIQVVDVLPSDIRLEDDPDAPEIQPFHLAPSVLLTLVGLLLLAVIGGLVIFSVLSEPSPPQSTPRSIAMVAPSLPPSNTPFLTATMSAPILVPTMTIVTPATLELVLERETRLRLRPDNGAPGLSFLQGGTDVTVLGRDISGEWLYVSVKDDLVGWIVIDSVVETIDASTIPVYGVTELTPETATLEPAVYPSTVFLTMTPLVLIPHTFEILLKSINISACDYPDFSLDYVFSLGGAKITITRPGDGSILTGSYHPDTAAFRASTTHTFGLEEMNGTISLTHGWLEVHGEQQLSYFDSSCNVLWSISGRVLAGGGY
jgi:hypothetical protein